VNAGEAKIAPPAPEMSLAINRTLPERPLKVATEPSTAAATKAVVASCAVFVPGLAVGPVGMPVNAGEAIGAA